MAEAVNFVALAFADLEGLDRVALFFHQSLEVGFFHPFFLGHIAGRTSHRDGCAEGQNESGEFEFHRNSFFFWGFSSRTGCPETELELP